MKMKLLTTAALATLGVAGCSDGDNDAPSPNLRVSVRSAEFAETSAPTMVDERAQTYTRFHPDDRFSKKVRNAHPTL